MKPLKTNTILNLSNNRKGIIKEHIGDGAQGSVYRISIDGKDMAMKVFRTYPQKEFAQVLFDNLNRPCPSPEFLWIQSIIQIQGHIAYIMPLRKKGYASMADIMLGRRSFSSWRALTNACLNITQAFFELHKQGLFFADVNDGSFFFDRQTGEVQICDCDNVCPRGTKYKGMVKGKQRYIAPEVLMGSTPDEDSDVYSMMVILFMLLMGGHPLEGRMMTEVPILTDEIEKLCYGRGVFVFDKKDLSNRPVMGIHSTMITRWAMMPPSTKELFHKAFSREERYSLIDYEILEEMNQLCRQVVTCGDHDILLNIAKKTTPCPVCGTKIPRPLILHSGKHRMPLMPDSIIPRSFACWADSQGNIGIVTHSTDTPEIWGIKNVSNKPISVTFPNKMEGVIEPQKGFPIYNGMSFSQENFHAEILDE